MIPPRNLSLLSNRLLEEDGGRRIPERVLDRDYTLSWFLICLSESPIGDDLIFKGGTALRKVHMPSYRFSEDLDFTLRPGAEWARVEPVLADVCDVGARRSGIPMAIANREETGNGHTLYIATTGPTRTELTTKIDVTLREYLAYPTERLPHRYECPEYSDLPLGAMITTYSLEEVAAEKVTAICSPARNEPRDLYDLWFLEGTARLRWGELAAAIVAKLDLRGQSSNDMSARFDTKESRMRARWEQRLGHQVAHLPPFEEVWRVVSRAFRRDELFVEIEKARR